MNTASFNTTPFLRPALHLAFWGLSYVILLKIFTINDPPAAVDRVYTLLFLFSIAPVVYINFWVLIPKLAAKGKWLLYGAAILISILYFSRVNYSFFDSWSADVLEEYFFISYYSWTEIIIFFLSFLVITTLLKLSKSWFLLEDLNRKLLQTEKEKLDMELAALKGQVNPHFFFNTLNSVYSLALTQNEQLPGIVLKLSDIMRYYLYQAGEARVPLEKEISIIKDYIHLQKLRSDANLELDVSLDSDPGQLEIAPLILLTFVENAFKHGAKGSLTKSYIRIRMTTEGKNFSFIVSNNKGRIDRELNDEGGLGLENVKRRLALLYPGKHELQIHDDGENFSIILKISL